MTSTNHQGAEADQAPRTGLVLFAAALAFAALGIAGYLSAQSLAGEAVAGCGGDAGCGAVLASRWARLGPVPVSLLGASAYGAVLVGLGLCFVFRGRSKVGQAILLTAAPAILVSAAWFTYLQLVEINEVCAYCMADHGIGAVLSVLILFIAINRATWLHARPIAIGAALACVMVFMQLAMPFDNEVASRDNPFPDRDGDAWIDDNQRFVSLFGGEVQFVLQDVPHHGDTHADQVVALLFDYACPHCRALHRLLDEAIAQDDSRFVVVPLPITIHADHNAYLSTESNKFADSYELATLSLAIAAIGREQWQAFDRWLLALDSAEGFPRSAAQARDKAEALVGRAALDAQLTGEAVKQHHATIDRNIQLMAGIDPPRYIPVVTAPGAPRHLTERFDDLAILERLLDEAAAGLKPADAELDQGDRIYSPR